MSIPNQPLRGLVAQGMDSRKSFAAANIVLLGGAVSSTPGSGSVTVTKPCLALIWGIGPGGSGSSMATTGGGGGGGAAGYRAVRVTTGQVISYTVGTPGAAAFGANGSAGTDTTITLPTGRILRAGGGGGRA